MRGVCIRAGGAFVAVGLMLVLGSSAAGQTGPLVFIGNGAHPYEVTEGGGTKTVSIPVTLDEASTMQVSVDWQTQSAWFQRTASDSGFHVDYPAAGGTVVFAPGEKTKTVSVSIFDDGIAEEDESFVVALSNPVGAQIGVPDDFWTHGAVVTIHDDELGAFIGEGGYTLYTDEGDSGTTPFEISLRLNFAGTAPVSVSWETRDAPFSQNTATPDQDYGAESGTVTFDPGETSRMIEVGVIGDTLAEPGERFSVAITDVVGARTGTPWDDWLLGATVEIRDDDPADISIADVTVNEGDTGTTNSTFTLTRSSLGNEKYPNPVTVDWAAEGVAAQAGSDFLAAGGTVTFEGLTATIDVPIVGDTAPEANETFEVKLSNAQNGVIADGVGIGTIVDDDGLPPAGPCIVLSKTSVAISGTASTPSTRRRAESEHLTVTNCGDSAVHLEAGATDATGSAGTWQLTNDSGGGSVCGVGVNVFRADVTLWLSGGQAATPLSTSNAPLVGADGSTPFTLGAAADQELSAGVDLPCVGSVGLGDPMATNITLTALAP